MNKHSQLLESTQQASTNMSSHGATYLTMSMQLALGTIKYNSWRK